MPLPKVSLTMIVKNEEKNLPVCLSTIADLVDEIIIVDTGSTDKTKEIALQFGAKVFDFPWVDSFAAARNESLKKASGRWILWIDADDHFDEENRAKLKNLFETLADERTAYYMTQSSSMENAPNEFTYFDRVHLFPNLPDLKWVYRVHEQIQPSLEKYNVTYLHSQVIFKHAGYSSNDVHRVKSARNQRLCELDLQDNPQDPFINFNLAWSLYGVEKHSKALIYWEKAFKYAKPSDSFRNKLLFLWSLSYFYLGNMENALEICVKGRDLYPDDLELLFLEALFRREKGQLPLSEQLFKKLFQSRNAVKHSAFNPNILECKAPCNLAEIYALQGRDVEAETHFRIALNYNGTYIPALFGLGALYIKHKKWAAVDKILMQLEALSAYDLAAQLRKNIDQIK